jgi:hypothetical protein
MKKSIASLSLVAMLAVVTARGGSLGIMVPAYFPPGPKWEAMNEAASKIPLIAIVNPNSGPGATPNANYVKALAQLHAAGGKAIGYVSSDYTRRSMAKVQSDIDQYLSWYDVDGFFIDEMTNDADTNHVDYYSTVYQYIKAKGSRYSVTGNPGANTQERYLQKPAADMLMIFESPGAKYANYSPASWVSKHSPENFVHLPYLCGGTETLTNYVSLAVARNAGWIYISDLKTYSRLPTYWTNEVELVHSLNAGSHSSTAMAPVKP